jgi:endonuclease-3 related protein
VEVPAATPVNATDRPKRFATVGGAGPSKDISDYSLTSDGAEDGFPSKLMHYFRTMSAAMGPLHWWPGETPFEVIVGAILTQNTAWSNVEKAIGNLRDAGMLTPVAIMDAPVGHLERLLRPSGYFRQKAKKLKAFVEFLQNAHQGSLTHLFATPLPELRTQLLAVHGIGPETADSILLYAGNQPVFVVDAYTHRIFGRHALLEGRSKYEDVRARFEGALPADPALFNEFHALIVNTGKQWCRKSAPRCEECPLRGLLPAGVNDPASAIDSRPHQTGAKS